MAPAEKAQKQVRAEALREASDRNLMEAFAALIPHSGVVFAERRSFGPVVAVATGHPVAFFNPVMVTDSGASAEELSAAVGWIQALDVAPSIQLRADLRERLEPAMLDLGLEPDPWVIPGMALDAIPPIPGPPVELRIEPAGSDRFEDWHAGVGYGANFRRIFPRSLFDDPRFRLVVGYLEDEPVTAAAAFMTDDAVGIYAVGTAEHARRCGFGEAVTWAAVQAGVEAGCSIAVLQSTEMALSLYRQMGFVEVCGYVLYAAA